MKESFTFSFTIISILLTNLGSFGYGQYSPDQMIHAFDRFSNSFNKLDTKSIYKSCSDRLKSEASYEVVNSLVIRIHNNKGNLVRFTKQQVIGNVSLFTVEADRGGWLFELTLSPNGEIEAFNFEEIPADIAIYSSHKSSLSLPFRGKWQVLWGGTTIEDNYHISTGLNNKYSSDFIIVDSLNRTYKNKGNLNEDYFAYGKDVISAADGEVVVVIDGVPENPPHTGNSTADSGNTIYIKHADNEFTVYQHLIPRSPKVVVGEKVAKGQTIGLCGNSGNSGVPHLHFNVVTNILPQLSSSTPQQFSNVRVHNKTMENYPKYAPKRFDFISNE